jgi:hypothetical protein
MYKRFLFLMIFLSLLVGPYLFAGTAHAQFQYFCKTPDGLPYWDYDPCAYQGSYNHDFDKGYPYNFNRNNFNRTPLDENSAR